VSFEILNAMPLAAYVLIDDAKRIIAYWIKYQTAL
jgi:hypothetical protein